jgi:uncharacterized protein (DUF1330 family)
MMPAYFIALCRAVHDRRTLEEYWNAVPPTFQGFGAKPLAIYTPLTLLESLGHPLEGAVLIEFSDLATAKSWYESPAYQTTKKIRFGAADAEIFFIDGGMTPSNERMPQTVNASL